MDNVGRLIDLEPVHDRGPADPAFGREPGDIEHSAALPEQQLQQSEKRGALFQMKELLHIAREIGVQPFRVKLGVQFGREQRGWHAAAQKPVAEVGHAKGRQLLVQHRCQLHHRLATREAVRELAGGGQGGGAGGQDFQVWKLVGPDLEQSAGVWKLVDLVKNHKRLSDTAVKAFRIPQSNSATEGRSQLRNSAPPRPRPNTTSCPCAWAR